MGALNRFPKKMVQSSGNKFDSFVSFGYRKITMLVNMGTQTELKAAATSVMATIVSMAGSCLRSGTLSS